MGPAEIAACHGFLAADKKPYGNGDGKVTPEELQAYLKGTMSYMAQRYYGREQTAQVATGAGR